MLRIALPLSLLALLATTAQAQVVTDPARATAALDSLLQSATAVRQQLHTQTHHFETKSPWSGRRRQRVRGFAPGASARYIWEQKTILRRNGVVVTRFTALQNGRQVLRERLLNGRQEYVWLKTQPSPAPATASVAAIPAGPVPGIYGVYLHGGYLRWNRNQYILPLPAAPAQTR